MWYPSQTCNKFMKLNHHAHSPNEKSIIKRTLQNVKDRTENFDGYFFHATKGKNAVISFMSKAGLPCMYI
jgi:hypothetical protein